MKSFAKFAVSILLLFLIGLNIQAEESDIQKLEFQKKNIHLLNSSKKESHTWWITDKQINVKIFSDKILRDNSFDKSGDWKKVIVPSNPIKLGVLPKSTTEAYYAKVFALPDNFHSSLTLLIQEISDKDKTYINGNFIGETGKWGSALPQAYDRTRAYDIPNNFLKDRNNIIVIHVKGYFPGEIGIMRNDVLLGKTSALTDYYLQQNYLQLLFLSSYLTVVAYFIFLYNKNFFI